MPFQSPAASSRTKGRVAPAAARTARTAHRRLLVSSRRHRESTSPAAATPPKSAARKSGWKNPNEMYVSGGRRPDDDQKAAVAAAVTTAGAPKAQAAARRTERPVRRHSSVSDKATTAPQAIAPCQVSTAIAIQRPTAASRRAVRPEPEDSGLSVGSGPGPSRLARKASSTARAHTDSAHVLIGVRELGPEDVTGTDREKQRADDPRSGPVDASAQASRQDDGDRREAHRHPGRAARDRVGRGARSLGQTRRQGQREVEERRPDRDAAGGEVHQRVEEDRSREVRRREARPPQVVRGVGVQRVHRSILGGLRARVKARGRPHENRGGQSHEEDRARFHRNHYASVRGRTARG